MHPYLAATCMKISWLWRNTYNVLNFIIYLYYLYFLFYIFYFFLFYLYFPSAIPARCGGGLPRCFIQISVPRSNSTNNIQTSLFQAFRWKGANVWNRQAWISLLSWIFDMFTRIRNVSFGTSVCLLFGVCCMTNLDELKSNEKNNAQCTSLIRSYPFFCFVFSYILNLCFSDVDKGWKEEHCMHWTHLHPGH